MTSKIIAVVAAAAGISLAAAACSEAATSSQAAPAGHVGAGRSSAQGPRTVLALAGNGHGTFGSGCRMLPRRGPGSQAGLATSPVAAAISREPGLSELAHAIRLAGLTRMLNAARALTVFAPDNAAFRALSAGNLQALLTTRPDLVRVLEYHLVASRVTPAELSRHHVLTTVAGTKIHVARFGHSLGLNNAAVTCGNVQTSNATVYVVNRLIVPTS